MPSRPARQINEGWFRKIPTTSVLRPISRMSRSNAYSASNADVGWGAWSVESGWTQAWITSVLALRRLGTSLWDILSQRDLEAHLADLAHAMWEEPGDAVGESPRA